MKNPSLSADLGNSYVRRNPKDRLIIFAEKIISQARRKKTRMRKGKLQRFRQNPMKRLIHPGPLPKLPRWKVNLMKKDTAAKRPARPAPVDLRIITTQIHCAWQRAMLGK